MSALLRNRRVAARRRFSFREIQASIRTVIEPLEAHQLLSGVTAATVADLISDINTANTAGGSHTINLAAGTSYVFTDVDNDWYGPNALPAISSNITIVGNGANLERSDGTSTPDFRFFYVSGGLSGLSAGTLTLQNLTLFNGEAKGGDSNGGGGGLGAGGAIFNQGTLDLSGVTIMHNTAQGGSSGVTTLGNGGGGIGADADASGDGGGFGPVWTSGFGGSGEDDITLTGQGGGGGGFTATTDNGSTTGAGGGVSALGSNNGDGGNGGTGIVGLPIENVVQPANISPVGHGGAGGDFGFGGTAGTASLPVMSVVVPDVEPFTVSGGGGGGGVGGGGGIGAAVFIVEPTITAVSPQPGNGGFGGGGAVNGKGGFGGGNSGLGGEGLGGAIFNMFGTTSMTNCTIANNTAAGGADSADASSANGEGGGVYSLDGTVNIKFTTIAFNTVSGGNGTNGGSVYIGSFGNTVDVGGAQDSELHAAAVIFSNSTGGMEDIVDEAHGAAHTNTATLDFTTPCLTDTTIAEINFGGNSTVTGTLNTGDPKLGMLGDYGGFTPTFPLGDMSDAIDAATPDVSVKRDQRGALRDAKPDIGSFEVVNSVVVTTTADEDDGTSDPSFGTGTSLREAVNFADANPTATTITFDSTVFPSGSVTPINLSLGFLAMNNDSNTTIDGDERVAVDGGKASNIFVVENGVTATIKNLTITNGSSVKAGGGIYDDGNLTLDNDLISNNTAVAGGGGIYVSDQGGLTVNGGAITGNMAVNSDGGGIYTQSGVSLTNVTVSSNHADGDGGGIKADIDVTNSLKTVTIDDSTFSDNTAGGNGGGAALISPNSFDRLNLSSTNSTFARNKAGNDGGGIYDSTDTGSSVMLANLTVSGNTANTNNVSGEGGGLFFITDIGIKSILDSIIARNLSGTTSPVADDISGSYTGSGNFIGGDPMLAPLGNNGGPTQTMAPLPNSPVIDTSDGASGATTDQRGFTRPKGSAPDIGAVEIQPVNTTITLAPSSAPYNSGATITLTATVIVPTSGNPGDNTGPVVGKVQFFDGSTSLGIVDVNGSKAQFSKVFAGGGHSFTAKYLGDGVHKASNSNTASLTVGASNHPPVAKNDSASTAPSTAVTVNVLANDSDPQGKALHVAAITSGPAHGSVTIVNNQIKYTPANNFFGTDTFVYRVTDTLNLSSTATVTITVGNGAGVGKDPDNSLTDLYVVGTPNPDNIQVNYAGTQGKATVIINGVNKGTFNFTGRIIGYGESGNDKITIDPRITRQSIIHGNDGNDFISGGGGNDILFGDAGNDSILGNGGRDILIGGLDADSANGGDGDDILIAGSTNYDNNMVAFDAIDKEWIRTDQNYTQRETHIINGGGQNVVGSTQIKLNSSTVFSAANPSDTLTGSTGQDLFYWNPVKSGGKSDIITDKASNEIAVSVHA